VIGPQDEHPHPVAPQAFQTWKENWCLCAVDPARRFAAVFHVSLRPVHGEAIFSGKLHAAGREHRHVRRHPIGPDPRALRPLSDGALTLEIVDPGSRLHVSYVSDELTAELDFAGRFGVFDFADGPLAPGESTLGEIGRHVFPFAHYEAVDGRGNRDHSWGFRDDFGFRHHHWICANFDSCFIGGSAMVETSYPGLKHGGAVASADGHDPIVEIDEAGTYWLQPGEPLPDLDRDVTYRLTTASGRVHTVTAHVSDPYALLYLNAKSEDRAQLYQDRQIFCDYTLAETGERGCGVLELGKYLAGPGVADRYGRRPVRA
jgi:hypothetical protein